jgi:hypothetical protein
LADKIRQAIDEIDFETSDPEKYHIDPDLKEKLANRIATFISKGVGNPSVVHDLVVKAHQEGHYPANTPQGRGENLRAYTDRIIAQFAVSSGAASLKKEGGKSLLVMKEQAPSSKQEAAKYEEPEPIIPKAIDREPNANPTT